MFNYLFDPDMKTTRWSLLTAMFFMAFADGITAQNQNPIDSLSKLLSTTIHDSTRAAAESELAYQYDLKSETLSSIKHYEAAIDLYLKLGDSVTAAKNLRWMAGTYQYANMLDKATAPFLRAIDILEKIGNREALAETHLYFADFFRVQRDLSNAQEELQKAEKIIKDRMRAKHFQLTFS